MSVALAKAAVIVMTLLILIAMGVVIYGLSGGLERSGPADLGAVELPVPAGCRIAELTGEGGVLALRLDGPLERGCNQVLLVDPRSGDLRGRLTVPPLD